MYTLCAAESQRMANSAGSSYPSHLGLSDSGGLCELRQSLSHPHPPRVPLPLHFESQM